MNGGKKGFRQGSVNEETIAMYLLETGDRKLPWSALLSDDNAAPPEPGPQAGRLDLGSLFREEKELILEIGSGNGDWLVNTLTEGADFNFIAVEMCKKMVIKTIWRLNKRGFEGRVKLFCGQAETFLQEFLPLGAAARIHIHYPDPWPKKRHHKRRLLNPAFLGLLKDALKPDGELVIVTDFEEYALEIREIFQGDKRFLPSREIDMTIHKDRVMGTNFERKALKVGSSLFQMRYRRSD